MSRFYDVLKQADQFQPLTRSGETAVETPVVNLTDLCEPPRQAAADETAVDEADAAGIAREPAAADPRPAETRDSVHTSINGRVRVIRHAVDPSVVEHYRRLRTRLLQERAAAEFRTVMIASPNPQEGKTLTALNLALSFSMLPEFRVLLVDGDLRKGTMGKWLGIDERPGLSNAIEGSAAMDDVVLRSDDLPLHFVVRGTSTVPPAELLNSPRAEGVFREMGERFDLVILDSPPLNLVTDGHLLARCCDGILLIARAFSTTAKSFEKVAQELHAFRVLGTVLNGAGRLERYRNYSGYSGETRP